MMSEIPNTEVAQAALPPFLKAFGGEAAAVRAEIKAYWQTPNASPYPLDIYNTLIDARIANGSVSHERGAFFKAYFAESFAPDSVTGYAPKHREPLIEYLVNAYAEAHPQVRLYRIEGDIMNLGGLNREILAHGGSKDLADAVIRMMANTLIRHLEPLGQLCPIRHGGDELAIYLNPSSGVDKKAIESALNDSKQEIAAFINKAGLRNLAHSKEGKPAGVGVGLAVADIYAKSGSLKTPIMLSAELEAGIDISKQHFQTLLGAAKTAQLGATSITHRLSIPRIESAFEEESYASLRHPPAAKEGLLTADTDFSGDAPASAHYARLKRAVVAASTGHLSGEEARLLRETCRLTQKTDFVTGLPLFEDMQKEMLPNFTSRFGERAKLVHVDFNNLGGGNKFGSWVGNAMANVFKECIETGMKDNGLKHFLPYLTTQGGGKFALLIPRTLDKNLANKLSSSIEGALENRSSESLKLSDEEAKITRRMMKEADKEGFAKRRHVPRRKEDPHRQHTGISIGDIANLKSRQKGAQVVCAATEFNLEKKPLGHWMDRLEGLAQRGQAAITNHHERHFEKRRHDNALDSEGEAPAPRHLRVEKIEENGRMVKKIVLERSASDPAPQSGNHGASR